MADTFTAALRLCKPEVGADENIWGTLLNNQTFDMVDEAVGGYLAISVTGGNIVLTALNGVTDQARCAVLNLTGAPGAARTVTAPNVKKTYWIINGVSDASVVTFLAGGGTSVAIPAGCNAKIFTDGAGNAVLLSINGAGLWTPTILFNNASAPGLTYGAQVGRWTRNGSNIWLACNITLTAKGSGTGAVYIGGIPFPPIAGLQNAASYECANMAAITGQIMGHIRPGSGNAPMYQFIANSNPGLTEANLTDTSIIYMSGSYQI